MYENALKGLGLSDRDIKIYLASLELGSATAPELAKKSLLKRTTVYSLLDNLVSTGILSTIYKGKKKMFRSVDPTQLVGMLDSRKASIVHILPHLTELFDGITIRPRISFFENKENLKQIYDDVLNCKSKKVYQIVKTKTHEEIMGLPFIREYVRKRVAKGITAYDLHPKSGETYTKERGTSNPALKRQVRYLPPQIFHASIIMLYDNKVAMISSKKESFGFIIESGDFSQTLQGYFDFMWGLGSTEPETSPENRQSTL